MGGVRLRKISAMHITKLLFGYPSEIKTVSDISAPDSRKEIVRGPSGGKNTQKTRKSGVFWTQKL